MKLDKKQLRFIARMSLLAQRIKPQSEVTEIEWTEEVELDLVEQKDLSGPRAKVTISFGPTHKLTFDFFSDSNPEEPGSTWSLTYDDGEIVANLDDKNQHTDDAWLEFRRTLGLT